MTLYYNYIAKQDRKKQDRKKQDRKKQDRKNRTAKNTQKTGQQNIHHSFKEVNLTDEHIYSGCCRLDSRSQ